MPSNAPLAKPPLSLALEYRRWHGWRDKVYGKLHPSRRQRIAATARTSLQYAGRMTYTEGPGRSELFHRPAGSFSGSSADCSQYVATLAHWHGVTTVDDRDYTGTLWEKFPEQPVPAVGLAVIWGPFPGVHTAILTGQRKGEWITVGFGHQGAPDANTLAGMDAYFTGIGKAGHRYIDLTR